MTAAVGLAFSVARPSAAQDSTRRDSVEAVLETSKVRNIVSSLRFRVLSELASDGSIRPDIRLRIDTLVSVHFADSVLYATVVQEFARFATGHELAQLTSWLFRPPASDFRTMVDGYTPRENLDQFAHRVRQAPPPRRRIELVARFVAANEAGRFYVGIDEAINDVAYVVARAAVGALTLPEVRPPTSPDTLRDREENGATFALLSFLHRFEPVPDSLLSAMVGLYEADSGRWFVASYSRAISQAIRQAGAELVKELVETKPSD